MGHAGASRKSLNDSPWETLSIRLSRPIFTKLLAAIQDSCGVPAHSWQLVCHGDENMKINSLTPDMGQLPCVVTLTGLGWYRRLDHIVPSIPYNLQSDIGAYTWVQQTACAREFSKTLSVYPVSHLSYTVIGTGWLSNSHFPMRPLAMGTTCTPICLQSIQGKGIMND